MRTKATPPMQASATLRANCQPSRLPAYGRAVLQLRRAGLAPTYRRIVVSRRWDWGRAFEPWRVVVADDCDPSALDLRILAGLDVWLAFGEGDPLLHSLVPAILRAKPRSAHGICVDADPCRFLWIKLTSGEVLWKP